MGLFRISGDEVEPIPERSYRDTQVSGFGESTLEQFLVEHPEVIPGEEIDPEDPPRFMVIRSQASVTPGSIDILLVDHKGIPTVVEAKLVDNREIRRTVLAQGVEYLAHLRREWTPDRMFEEGREFWNKRGLDFETEALKRLGLSFEGEFVDKVAANLDGNRMRLIIASDRIPSELRTVVEFLNETSSFEVYGLEVRFFATEEESHRILAPRIVGFTERARKRPRGERWNAERFFLALEQTGAPQEVDLARDLMDFGVEISGRAVEWGTGKARGSFTARLLVDDERFSLFSAYTTGQFSLNIGWNHERLARIGPDLSERYRAQVKSRLSIDFDRNSWERGWPMADLSVLVPDNAGGFKELLRGFVAEVQERSQEDRPGKSM